MAHSQRASSPADEATLTRPRVSRSAENPLKMDKNYRRFGATIERALGLFDIQEWADYISFLSRLLKVRYLSMSVPC